MDDLIFASVKDLAQAIKAKAVSSEEVVKACLQRIDAVNGQLNATVNQRQTRLLIRPEKPTRLSPGGSRGFCMASP